MNRPSRTEDDLEHPTWNQNPPFLAPDLTTRQDLNGIANARVQRNRSSGASGVADGLLDEKHVGGEFGISSPENPRRPAKLATGQQGMYYPVAVASHHESGRPLGGEGRAAPLFSLLGDYSVRQSSSKLTGWIAWIASVVAVSAVINLAGNRVLPAVLFSSASTPGVGVGTTAAQKLPLRRLSRRDDGSCGSGGLGEEEYNTPLHVGALLIILGVSSLACATPLLALRFPALRVPASVLFAFRHFGTGVLLATAFVHLLPTAFLSLGDPCLSSFWTSDYPAMPGAIALAGVFFVSVIEMVFSPARQYSVSDGVKQADHGTRENLTMDAAPATREKTTGGGGHGHCNHASVAAIITRPSNSNPQTERQQQQQNSAGAEESGTQALELTPEQQHKKAILQCMMLEVGILFHSVFIGMALSVAIGSDFIVLLIAIAFHQTFEGLALGARIATIKWPKKTWQPYLMVLAYGCTTPVGQAIGLATHTLYDPSSEFGLILVGTMNAISSGLLVFASLIELLAEDFLSDESWVVLRGGRRVVACVLVFAGAVGMSVVGAWA